MSKTFASHPLSKLWSDQNESPKDIYKMKCTNEHGYFVIRLPKIMYGMNKNISMIFI